MSHPPADSLPLTRGYSIALISAVVLSLTAILIRHLTEAYGMPALVLAFWRDALVALILLPVLLLLRTRGLWVGPGHRPFLLLFGLNLAVFNALWTLAVSLTGAAVATVLVYSSVAFTALLGRWLYGESLDWAKLVAVACGLGGCVLVAEAFDPAVWRSNPMGIAAGLLSGLCYAVYTLMGRSASRRGLDPWATVLHVFAVAAVILLAANLVPGELLPGTVARPAELLWLGDEWAGWGVLLLLAAGPTVVGFGLYNVSLTHLPSSVANLILTTEPAFTAAIAYAFLGERLSLVQVGGGVLILGGVVLLRAQEIRRYRRAAPEPGGGGPSGARLQPAAEPTRPG